MICSIQTYSRILFFGVLVLLLLDRGDSFASLVTGANGFLGRAIAHELIDADCQDDQQSHQVICLVRKQHVESERTYWQRHVETSNTKVVVRVLPYDMLDGGVSFRAALDEIESDSSVCIHHVASVFGPTHNHTRTALENVKGTCHVVHALHDARQQQPNNLYKLILTSSMASVRATGQTPDNGKYYTHLDWNVQSMLGKSWSESYQWSKAESERKARDLCKQYSIPMTSICPSFVFGPGQSGSYSIDLVGKWVRGEAPVQSRLFVDVRDVAKAHVAAGAILNTMNAGDRYIVSKEERVPSKEIANWLIEIRTKMGFSDPGKVHYDASFDGGAIPIGQLEVEATDRLQRDLGIKLRPVKDTIVDMATQLLERETKEAQFNS
jgi:nucleoside-diphosphate-sugar epimerase